MTVLSIVICTFNRAQLLRDLLDRLVEQCHSLYQVEVMVVDNGSTDETVEIAKEYMRNMSTMKYYLEPRVGLSHVRNRGWKEALGEYVGYLDDDCRPEGNWIRNALKIIEELRPGAFGGPYYAFTDEPVPKWFRYGNHVPKEYSSFLGKGEWWALSGGNLVIRKDLLAELGGFNPGLGKRGSELAFGEETELLRRLFERYPEERYYYDRDLVVYHGVDPRKARLFYSLRARLAGGRDHFRVKGRGVEGKRLILGANLARTLIRVLWKAFLGGIWRDRVKYPYYHNFLWERVLPDVTKLGYIWASIRYKGAWGSRCDSYTPEVSDPDDSQSN